MHRLYKGGSIRAKSLVIYTRHLIMRPFLPLRIDVIASLSTAIKWHTNRRLQPARSKMRAERAVKRSQAKIHREKRNPLPVLYQLQKHTVAEIKSPQAQWTVPNILLTVRARLLQKQRATRRRIFAMVGYTGPVSCPFFVCFRSIIVWLGCSLRVLKEM